MRLNFNREKAQKQYLFEYKEILDIKSITNSQNIQTFTFNMGSIGDRVAFSNLNSPQKESGELEEILETFKVIFDMIILKLDETGKIEKITNHEDILKKYNDIRNDKLSNITDVNRKNFIFEVSKIVNNDGLLTALVRHYSIFPYIFMGLHNKNYSTNTPQRMETIIHNIFPMTNIPVVLEIYGREENGMKLLEVVGKERHDFDRFAYMKKLDKKYPELSKISRDSFDCKIKGNYIYDSNDVLTGFSIVLNIETKGLVKYQLGYNLKEN